MDPIINKRNNALRQEFLDAIRKANLRFLRQADVKATYQVDHVLVVGLAFWSQPDLKVLNKLIEKLSHDQTDLFVFDIDEFGFSDGIKVFIPGVKLPNKTPVIAEYQKGMLVRSAEGNVAIEWVKGL